MKEKKKLLHLVEAFGGGVFTFLVETTNEMCSDYDITIAYSKRNQTPENFEEYFDKRIKFIEVKNFTRSIGIKDIKACKEVKAIVKELNPDIVHMHSSKAGVVGRIAISGKNRKLFYTPHGYSFLKQDDTKLKRFCYKSIEKMMTIIRPSCKVVACSEGEYNVTLPITKNCTFVNNGVNIKEIEEIIGKDVKNDIDRDNLTICTVGRIGFQKDPETFNEIAKRTPNVKYTWIGDGELRDKLTSENITITGWLDKKEVLKNVLNHGIFLLCSKWEGLSLALVENMLAKRLIISSAAPGNREVINNGVNGFACNSVDEYVDVINRIQNGEIDCDKIIQESYNEVLTMYNIDCMVNGYKKIYEGECA